jgi:hypothetical protein
MLSSMPLSGTGSVLHLDYVASIVTDDQPVKRRSRILGERYEYVDQKWALQNQALDLSIDPKAYPGQSCDDYRIAV